VPQSVVRFIQLSSNEHPPPFAASAFAAISFSSSGFLNVLLYVYTRPSLLPRECAVDDDDSMDKLPDVHDTLPTFELNALDHGRLDPIRSQPYSDCSMMADDLEAAREYIDDLRRQLGAHEQSLKRLQERLAAPRRRKGVPDHP
jgi:hypothetical protein